MDCYFTTLFRLHNHVPEET